MKTSRWIQTSGAVWTARAGFAQAEETATNDVVRTGGVINIITKKGGDKPIGGGISTSYDSGNNGLRQGYDVHGIEYAVSYGTSESENRKTATGQLDEGGMSAKDPSVKRTSGTGSNREEYSVYLGYKTNNIHAEIRYDHHKMDSNIHSTQDPSVVNMGPLTRMTTQDV